VLAFYNATGASLVFGTSYHGTDLSNLGALLAYTAAAGNVQLAGLELGEEMDPETSPDFDSLVAAYGDLRQLASQLWPSSPPKILGPSTGMNEENTQSRFMTRFLNTTLAKGLLDGVNMHSCKKRSRASLPSPPPLADAAVTLATCAAHCPVGLG